MREKEKGRKKDKESPQQPTQTAIDSSGFEFQ